MPTFKPGLCAERHQELSLMTEATTFCDRLPVMHCRRCGENLSFEEAVRNDERIKIARDIQALHDRFVEDGGLLAELGSFAASQALLAVRLRGTVEVS